MSTPTYSAGDGLPSITLPWQDSSGNVIDFSSGYTFRLRLARNGITELSKTTGIIGAATSPNITIDWATGELDIDAGLYEAHLVATRTSDNKDRSYRFAVQLLAAIPAP